MAVQTSLLGSIQAICSAEGFPGPVKEFRFSKDRKWKFDFAWPQLQVAFEREGGTWTQGRHTRGGGYSKDAEKYNAAAILGWIVIRGTSDMIKQGSVFNQLIEAMKTRKHHLLESLEESQ